MFVLIRLSEVSTRLRIDTATPGEVRHSSASSLISNDMGLKCVENSQVAVQQHKERMTGIELLTPIENGAISAN